MPPRASFESGHSTVSLESKEYHSSDVVDLKVRVEAGVKAAIINIKTGKASIEEWENRTLYSGGQKTWGSTIISTNKEGVDFEYVSLSIPDIKGPTDEVIEVEVIVEYVYASITGSSPTGLLFDNVWDADTVRIEIKIKM